MNKVLFASLIAAILLAGTAQATRDRRPHAAPAACILPGEVAPVVFEGRGLAFVPGGGTEPVIVRRIEPTPCSTS